MYIYDAILIICHVCADMLLEMAAPLVWSWYHNNFYTSLYIVTCAAQMLQLSATYNFYKYIHKIAQYLNAQLVHIQVYKGVFFIYVHRNMNNIQFTLWNMTYFIYNAAQWTTFVVYYYIVSYVQDIICLSKYRFNLKFH